MLINFMPVRRANIFIKTFNIGKCSRIVATMKVSFVVAICCGVLSECGSADAADNCWSMGAGQFANDIAFCVSAEVPASARNAYGPRGLADSNPQTAWCAPSGLHGPFPWIEIRIDDGAEFRRVLVQNGYGKSPEVYRQNSRPRTLEISVDNGPAARVTLPDYHDMAAVELPSAGKHRAVRLSILDVYPGEKYTDFCLDYVMPDFEYEESLSRPPPPASKEDERAKDNAKPPTPPKPLDGKVPFGDLGLPSDKDLELEPR